VPCRSLGKIAISPENVYSPEKFQEPWPLCEYGHVAILLRADRPSRQASRDSRSSVEATREFRRVSVQEADNWIFAFNMNGLRTSARWSDNSFVPAASDAGVYVRHVYVIA